MAFTVRLCTPIIVFQFSSAYIKNRLNQLVSALAFQITTVNKEHISNLAAFICNNSFDDTSGQVVVFGRNTFASLLIENCTRPTESVTPSILSQSELLLATKEYRSKPWASCFPVRILEYCYDVPETVVKDGFTGWVLQAYALADGGHWAKASKHLFSEHCRGSSFGLRVTLFLVYVTPLTIVPDSDLILMEGFHFRLRASRGKS